MGFRVLGSGFRVLDFGFRIEGLGFRVYGGVESRGEGPGFSV